MFFRFKDSQRCNCNSGFAGESCSLTSTANSELNSWHTLSSKSPLFKARSGHVSGYFAQSDSIVVFGGKKYLLLSSNSFSLTLIKINGILNVLEYNKQKIP